MLMLQRCPFHRPFHSPAVSACYAEPRYPKQDAVRMTTSTHFITTLLGRPKLERLRKAYMQLAYHLHQAMSTCEENLLRLHCCPFLQSFHSPEVSACYAEPRYPKQDAVRMTTTCQSSVTASGGPVKFLSQDPDNLSRRHILRVLWTVR